MCFVTALFHYFANRNPQKFVRLAHPWSVFFILEAVAFFFSVQMFLVTPYLLSEVGLYEPAWVVAIFIVHNILGNMWACHCTKSSVASLPENRRVPEPGEEHLWHFCEPCQAMMPPRSWHCKLCECCILKRDHHCTITATCIGHNNLRYFFWFIFYLTLGTFLCFCTTLLYLANDYMLVACIVQRILPSRMGPSCKVPNHLIIDFVFARVLLFITVYALVACLVMLLIQVQFVWCNTTFFTGDDPTYDLGFRKNFRLVLGERGLWTMLSPAIRSPLPHDGTQWRKKQDLVEV